MIKLVIFDFDGVLVDSNEAWAGVLNTACRAAGLDKPFSKDELRRYCGKSYEDVIIAFHPELEDDEPTLTKVYRNLIQLASKEDFIDSLAMIDGVKDILEKLKARYHLAVCSGNIRQLLERFLSSLGIRGYMELVVSMNDVKRGKPDPEMIIRTLHHFGVKPGEAVYVCDSRSDVKAAKAADVKSVVVLTGALTREEAEKLEPDHIIESCRRLEDVI